MRALVASATKVVRAALFLATSFSAVAAHAQGFGAQTEAMLPSDLSTPWPLTPQCLTKASQLERIPAEILLGILKTEGGHIGSETPNRDGSRDLGPMQINDRTWVGRMANANFDGDRSRAYAALRDDGCYNIMVGAWVLKQYLDEANGDYRDAVGFYNSHNTAHKEAYERRFAANFGVILEMMGELQVASR